MTKDAKVSVVAGGESEPKAASEATTMLTIFTVSGGTGETAERVAHAVLVQFGNAPTKLVRRDNIRTPEQVRAIVQEARTQDSLILYTLVDEQLRHFMLTESRLYGVDSVDLLGPVLNRFAAHFKIAPLGKPGLLAQLTEAKSREIEAVDFAFRHDDGCNAEQLARAEVVLVGVSRTMKTPTMLYLAYREWFAANVPLVLEVPVPPVLLALPSERVLCLTMAPDRLRELRSIRARQSAIPLEPYASPEYIQKELRYAEQLCLSQGWRRVDVTGKSVEEVASEIIAMLSGPGITRQRA